MSTHQQVTIVRDTAETNGETDALAEAIKQAENPQPEATTPDRPEWLPEKFKAPEEMAQAYSELEKRLGQGAGNFSVEALEPFSKEFYENGDLSEESIQKVVSLGLPEQVVRAYVDGQKAVLESQTNAIMQTVGGEQQYQSMIEWASENIDETEIDAFNSIMESGNMPSIKMAVEGLRARYEKAAGSSTGKLIQGEATGPAGGAFRSIAEIVAAMKDPRYARDPAYRKDVESRVALSNALGVNAR
jgi:hypothetical protein